MKQWYVLQAILLTINRCFNVLMTTVWQVTHAYHYSTLMVILSMPCYGCRVVSHGMAILSDAFTHRIPFLSLVINIKDITCENDRQFSFWYQFFYQWRVDAIAGAVGQAISGSCSTDSTSRKETANVANIPKNCNRQHEPKGHGTCCKYSKWQCLTDTSILTMICTRYIYVLTRNRNNDNPFLAYNRPFQLSTFQATASCVCERDPSAHKVSWVL